MGGLSLFGGSDTRTTTNLDVTDISLSSLDHRQVEGENVSLGGNVNVNQNILPAEGNGTTTSGAAVTAPVVNVSTTDFGALEAGRDLAENAFIFADNVTGSNTELTSKLIENAAESAEATVKAGTEAAQSVASSASGLASKALNVASEATRDEQARTIQFLIIGGVVIAGIGLYLKTRKS